NEPCLARRHPHVLGLRADFSGCLDGAHRRFFTSVLRSPEWPRNVRVGANSPSLCPTICSETNTGTCLRPSWTAIVCPTISGKTVEVRDQVRIIRFSFFSFIASIRLISRSSTNGPFLELLLMCFSSIHPSGAMGQTSSSFFLTSSPRPDDELVRFLVLSARALAQCGHPPRRHRMPAALRLSLAAAVRVVDGVHRGPAHRRPLALPPAAPRLAARDVLVVDVADLSHGSAAFEGDAAHLTGGEAQDAEPLVLGDELHARTGASGQLSAFARLQLDVVHQRTGGDVLERQRVPRLDVSRRARLDGGTDAQPCRCEDVAL